MKKEEFTNLIKFCILMENNKGISSKSPRYVLEKYTNREFAILDSNNMVKFTDYLRTWHKAIDNVDS